jgi:uncharacterized membrane protein
MAAENAPRPRRFSVEIDAPPDAVYACWTRFDQAPRISPAILRTQQVGPRHLLFEALDGIGRRRLWEVEIVERVPGCRVAWRSQSASAAGSVELSPLPGVRTRLELVVQYRPSGLLERVADALGWIDAGVRRDLRRFGRFAEGASRDRAL